MLRLLHRHFFTLSIASDRSCRPTLLRLIHGKLSKTQNSSFSDITTSYLVGSCGLSPAAAISVAKNFTFKTDTSTTNADSFLSLLRSHGFTQSQIADIIIKFPSLLTYNPEKKIKPKLEFFLNLGYSRAELVKLITADIHILKNSLEKRIKPNYDTLKDILGTDKEIIVAIGNSSRLLRQNLDRYLLPNIKTLRDLGVPGHRIVKLVTFYPRSLLINPEQFSKAVDLLKKMGFDVTKSVFTLGVNVLTVLCNSTWNRKFKIYRSLGWSDDDVLTAFKKHPFCMLMSENKIRHNFNFFAKELEWTPSFVASRPVCLFFSFENTIFPRYKIFRMLESEGLLKINGSFSTLLWLPKKKFLNRYVAKFADQVPELLEVYKDNLALSGLRSHPHVIKFSSKSLLGAAAASQLCSCSCAAQEAAAGKQLRGKLLSVWLQLSENSCGAVVSGEMTKLPLFGKTAKKILLSCSTALNFKREELISNPKRYSDL